ncbi:MAG: D-cysteine desulfhydrase family protein [Armatimonadetes bacterium]|nr:D-cysteine desulfhydrase family protein [Armatimonadota bacterium]
MLDRKLNLVCVPTSLHRLDRASELLCTELWIKRDDLTGFAGGGNKGRKLEYLMADAIGQGADTVVTHGAWQSNFIRQAGAACRVLGLDFHATAMEWPYPGRGRETKPSDWPSNPHIQGNQILDGWLGLDVQKLPDSDWNELETQSHALACRLRSEGRNVYEIPGGGSTGIGALGFVSAAQELLMQDATFDRIIVACGSGATQAGLAYGIARAGANTKVVGICTDNEPELVDVLGSISSDLDGLLLTKLRMVQGDFDLRMDYCGKGYQVPTEESRDAIEMLAKAEGIFLDPVYTSKAFAGLVDLAKNGELTGKTLFWHTGGFPGLFVEGYEPRLH